MSTKTLAPSALGTLLALVIATPAFAGGNRSYVWTSGDDDSGNGLDELESFDLCIDAVGFLHDDDAGAVGILVVYFDTRQTRELVYGVVERLRPHRNSDA